MIAVAFFFTSGGYHATPWGRHVNEGTPEWPPSLWRILRALIAVRFRTLPDDTDVRDLTATLKSLLVKLAEPPEFTLPPATLTHTRHYVPWQKKGPDDRAKIFDTFMEVERAQPLIARWPNADVSDGERSLLKQLLENLPYLGRAESWCRAQIWNGNAVANCFPLHDASALPGNEVDLVRVLVPASGDPDSLFAALSVDVEDLRLRDRLREPALSRWQLYGRSREALNPTTDRILPAPERLESVTVARYALDGHPRPLLVAAVSVADLARRACLALYGRQNDQAVSAAFAGKSPDGVPLQGHQHAFYLPTDEDDDGYLDHLTIFAPVGFDRKEQQVLGSLTQLRTWRAPEPMPLLLLGLGRVDDFAPVSWLGASQDWRSITPFMLNRHPKNTRAGIPKIGPSGRQIDGPEDQVRREWEYRRTQAPELPSLVDVEHLPNNALGSQRRWSDFQRFRPGDHLESPGSIFGFRLRFAEAITGPLLLGANAHFGLGFFRPVSSESDPRLMPAMTEVAAASTFRTPS